RRERSTAKAPPPSARTAAAPPRTTHRVVLLLSEASSAEADTEDWSSADPSEGFADGAPDAETGLPDSSSTPFSFSLASGPTSAGPGSKSGLSSTLRGRIRPKPRQMLGTSLSHWRPAVSIRLARTWLAVQSGCE